MQYYTMPEPRETLWKLITPEYPFTQIFLQMCNAGGPNLRWKSASENILLLMQCFTQLNFVWWLMVRLSKLLLINPDTTYSALSHMEMGFPSAPSLCPTVCLLKKLWDSIKRRLGVDGFLSSTPIWRNKFYAELAKLSGYSQWEVTGIKYFASIL